METSAQSGVIAGDGSANPAAWIRGLLADPAIRYGLKFGLAGVLAVFISLVIRLDKPGWALITVFVLMTAQYVGAIAEKSVFRLIGTVIGGLTGYLLTAGYQQNPVIYLTLLGVIIGTATALFGQSRYPYAFLLCGMTTLVVASNGMGDPDNSWQYMLWRIEEVTVGLLVTMVVQSILWPRFARIEFLELLRSSFTDLRACFLNAPGIRGPGTSKSEMLQARGFPGRISGLRTLLEFGARESLNFRCRLETYFELTACLGRIAHAIAVLREPLPADSIYREYVGSELDALHEAMAEALEELGQNGGNRSSRADRRNVLAAACRALEEKFLLMRGVHIAQKIPPDQALVMGLHVSGLDQIREQIEKAHALLDSLPEYPLQREFAPQPLVSPWPPPFWVKTGIKSGLAVVIAFLIDNWLNPPGGPMFVLGAWVFTALNAASPGGQGDRRAFHLLPPQVLVLAATSLAILAVRPFLSSYAVMNTVIFGYLFVWGYLSFRTRGMTIPMQLAMLVLLGILNLNGQKPISFESVSDFFFGLVLALVLSALLQRLFWPSLPQWEIRDRVVEALDICRAMLAREPLPLWKRTRLTLIPGEVDIRLEHLDQPICPAGEPEKLRELVLMIVGLGGNLAVAVEGGTPQIPRARLDSGRELTRRMEQLFDEQLAAIQDAFRKGARFQTGEEKIPAAVAAWKDWAVQTRLDLLNAEFPPLELARVTGRAERYNLMGADVIAMGRLCAGLRLPLYMGDYSL